MVDHKTAVAIILIVVSSSSSSSCLLVDCTQTGDHVEESRVHVLEVASLFPASVCTTSPSSPSSSSSSTDGRSRLQVFHLESPCYSKDDDATSSTPAPSSSLLLLSHDQARVEYLGARLNRGVLPVQPDPSYFSSGNYFVRVGLGTPTKTLALVIDTGSDLTWTQCLPCVSCYQQKDPIFDPSSSPSHSDVPCTSSECHQLASATGNTPRCTTECLYRIHYSDCWGAAEAEKSNCP